jgi:uncharacterized membrane protein
VNIDHAIRAAAVGVEIAGVAAILIGALAATAAFLKGVLFGTAGEGIAFKRYRQQLGRAILLGLEFLVAADIIKTVALEPTPQTVATLAGIVAIRTFLSFALEVELEGRWPWQRAAAPTPEQGGSVRA